MRKCHLTRYTVPYMPGDEIMKYPFYQHGYDGVQGLTELLMTLGQWHFAAEDVSIVSTKEIAPPSMKERTCVCTQTERQASRHDRQMQKRACTSLPCTCMRAHMCLSQGIRV